MKKEKRIVKITTWLLAVLLLLHKNSFAQSSGILDSLKHKYPFINYEANSIYNASALNNFFERLKKLPVDTNKQKVVVTHIGDSHIQADYFSGRMRKKLQRNYGNAGRGLVFPYRVAKTTEPSDIYSSSPKPWESKRNVLINNPLPIGVSGVTINSTDSSSEFKITQSEVPLFDYRFNKITLFHEKGHEAYDLFVVDNNNNVRSFVNSNLVKQNPLSSIIQLDTLLYSVTFKSYKRDSSKQKRTQIYGLILERDSSGILYNTIGINGAEYRHYNASVKFQEQLAQLKSDLIIISLGTNEAVSIKFNADEFLHQADSLIREIKKYNPSASILLTGPGDFYRKKKYKNKNLDPLAIVLKEYCEKNNLAFWDWHTVMGGTGSITKWVKKNLAQKDFLHLTRYGYELQGDLLYYALMKELQK